MGQQLPQVSVITAAYNRAAYLDETILSVLNQDYPRIEYVVLDDGSTDNTRDVLEKYHGWITWETHPNMSEARTVNKGVGMTHGEYVMMLSSDDPLLPGAMREGVKIPVRDSLCRWIHPPSVDGAFSEVDHVLQPRNGETAESKEASTANNLWFTQALSIPGDLGVTSGFAPCGAPTTSTGIQGGHLWQLVKGEQLARMFPM